MMAAVLYGKEHLLVESVAVPTIGNGDILVRVKVALTCGTDVKVFRRGYHARMIVPPAVFGLELASGWWRPIPPLATIVSSAAAASKIFAKIFCSTTAPMPSTSEFRNASFNAIHTRSRRV